MRRSWPIWITALVGALLTVGCGSEMSDFESKRVSTALEDSMLSTTESWDVDMNMLENEVRIVRLRAPYSASYEIGADTETRFEGPVSIQIFDTSGTISTSVSCMQALYRARSSEFEFSGNVIVETDEGKKLRSEFLEWFQKTGTIQSDKYVIITAPGDSIAGYGLTGTEDLSEYTIKNVSGRVELN